MPHASIMTEFNAAEAKLARAFLEKPLKTLCRLETKEHANGAWLTNERGTTYAILLLEPPHPQTGLSRLRFTIDGNPLFSIKGADWMVLFEPWADRFHMVAYEEFRSRMQGKVNPEYMSVWQEDAGPVVTMHLDWAKGSKLIKKTQDLKKGSFLAYREEQLREPERFVHLHNHSTFSLLDGASTVEGIARRAYLNGQPGIALTDHGNCFGAYKHWEACTERGIKPIMGCEIYLVDDVNKKYTDDSGTIRRFEHHLTLIASDQTGWANLSKMMTRGSRDHYYYVPRIDYAMLREFNAGIICLTGCFKGPVAHFLQTQSKKDSETVLPWWRQRNVDLAVKNLQTLQGIFGDRLYGECMNIDFAQYAAIVPELMGIFDSYKVAKLLTNDCHYEVAEDAELQAMMTLISNQKVDDVGGQIKKTGDLFIRDTNELTAGAPWVTKDMLERTMEVADRCSLTFEHGRPRFPKYDMEKDPHWESFVKNGKKAIVPRPS